MCLCKLVSPRYRPGECLSNQRFMDERGHAITDQVDVAALSHSLRWIEGYECKLKVDGIESSDCTNLAWLATAAKEREYRSHVAIISLDHRLYMHNRLQRLQPDPAIKLYGVDTLPMLADTPFGNE